MKLGLIAALSLAVFVVEVVQARQNSQGVGGGSIVTGLQDQQCWGGTPSGLSGAPAEVCVNSSANIEPTTAGTLLLGTTSYPFQGVNVSSINPLGAQLVIPLASTTTLTIGTTGLVVIQGTSALSNLPASNIVLKGLVSYFDVTMSTRQQADSNFGLQGGSTIPVNGSYETLLSTGIGVTLTNTPVIATTTIVGGGAAANFQNIQDGTYLVLTTTAANTNLIFLSSTTSLATGLHLGSASRILSQGSIISFVFNAALGLWLEVAFVR